MPIARISLQLSKYSARPLTRVRLNHSNILCFSHRYLSTNRPHNAALASKPPAAPTVVVFQPSPEYIEQEELDVELLPPESVKLVITDRAAEQLRTIAAREKNPDAALRVSVESGGCHGYQYKMALATSRSLDD